jgi:hypothetical protein
VKKKELLPTTTRENVMAEDLEPEHRELLIPFGASGYVIFYETLDNDVCILAVKHQKEAGY